MTVAESNRFAIMNHYTTLSLQSPPYPTSTDAIKRAYHAALLTHHPDKNSPVTSLGSDSPSIDAIKLAYTILSNPVKRAEYDRQLLLEQKQHPTLAGQGQERVLGNETIDLDDMTPLEDGSSWQRVCRCGDPIGYVVKESELEDATSRGAHEVLVGCAGCSLAIRVLFGVADEEIDQGG